MRMKKRERKREKERKIDNEGVCEEVMLFYVMLIDLKPSDTFWEREREREREREFVRQLFVGKTVLPVKVAPLFYFVVRKLCLSCELE